MEEFKSEPAKKILVFGTTGVGKTSLLSALSKQNLEISTGDICGVTFDYKEIKVTYDGKNYVFLDTVGMNEGKGGKINPEEAVNKLILLLKKCKTEGGINLIIFVTHYKVTEITKSNFDLVVSKLTGQRVPVIYLATHLENAVKSAEIKYMKTELNLWSAQNKPALIQRDMIADKYVGSCFLVRGSTSETPVVKNLVAASTDLVWEAIQVYSSKDPIDFITPTGIWSIIVQIIKKFGDLMGIRLDYLLVGNIWKHLREIGELSEEEAKNLAATIPLPSTYNKY